MSKDSLSGSSRVSARSRITGSATSTKGDGKRRRHVRIAIGTEAGLRCEFIIKATAKNRAKACEELGRVVGAALREITAGDEELQARFLGWLDGALAKAKTGAAVEFNSESEVAA